jgi:hypothetical protein
MSTNGSLGGNTPHWAAGNAKQAVEARQEAQVNVQRQANSNRAVNERYRATAEAARQKDADKRQALSGFRRPGETTKQPPAPPAGANRPKFKNEQPEAPQRHGALNRFQNWVGSRKAARSKPMSAAPSNLPPRPGATPNRPTPSGPVPPRPSRG